MTSQNLQPLPDSHGLLVCPRSADVDPPLSLFVSLAQEFIIQTIPFEFFFPLLCFAYGKPMQDLFFRAIAKHF